MFLALDTTMVERETTCPTCGNEFSSESNMKIHHTKAHDESITGHDVACSRCGDIFSKNPGLIERDDNHYCTKQCRISAQTRSKGEIVDFLHDLKEDLGRTPVRDDLRGNTGIDHKTINRHFESWNAALKAAGMEINEVWTLTEQECIEDIQRTYDKLGHSPKVKEHREHGSININTIIQKFGKWTKAVSEAGLSTQRIVERNIPKEDLIAEIERVHNVLGRTPMLKDMDRLSAYSNSTYQKRLGWTETLEELGYELNYGSDGEYSPRKYSSDWPEQKEKAKQRDGFECLRCGESNEEHINRTGKQLHVHHITWNEDESPKERDRLENLLTLCSTCHPKIEKLPIRPEYRDGVSLDD